MSNYRRRNFAANVTPIPTPSAAVKFASESAGLDEAVFVRWDYPGKDADTLDGFRVEVKLSAATVRQLFVPVPNRDLEVTGLSNDTTYSIIVTPINAGGDGPAAVLELTPQGTEIPSPNFMGATAGNGRAEVEWQLVLMPIGYEFDRISFEAVRLDTHAVTDGPVNVTDEGRGWIPLDNEVSWTVVLITVARRVSDGKLIPSSPSSVFEVRPTNPLPPYRPVITACSMNKENDGYFSISYEPGDRPLGVTGNPLEITAWEIQIDNGSTFGPPADIRTLEHLGPVTPGEHLITVRARNPIGWSPDSEPFPLTYNPTETRPFTADKPFAGPYEAADGYEYAFFDPGDDTSREGDRIWRCTRTSPGSIVELEVLAVGGGGGGKGQTLTLGKGGDGGGGQMTLDTLPPTEELTTFTVTLSTPGSQTKPDARTTQVSEKSKAILAASGHTATSSSDADGFPPLQVPAAWRAYAPFAWDLPKSTYVGGTVGPTDTKYPDGTYYGQGGAGTKTSKPGRGEQGVVVIRWKKLTEAQLEHTTAKRPRWWRRR